MFPSHRQAFHFVSCFQEITFADDSEVSSGYSAKNDADFCRLSFSAAQENCLPHTQNTVLQPSPLAIAMLQDGHDITV